MRKKICYLMVQFLFLVFAGMLQATTFNYTLDFNETAETQNQTGLFSIDAIPDIDTASIEFIIKGKTTYTNSRGYSWYYDPTIDISVDGVQVSDAYHLGGDFSVLQFDLSTDTLSDMEINQSLAFEIIAQDAFWWSDLSPWGGTSSTRFYLDQVNLLVTSSGSTVPGLPVPEPGTGFLFGCGLAGLAALQRRKK